MGFALNGSLLAIFIFHIFASNASAAEVVSFADFKNKRIPPADCKVAFTGSDIQQERLDVGKDVGPIAYPDLRLKWVHPNPLDRTATGLVVDGISRMLTAGVHGTQPYPFRNAYPAHMQVALSPDQQILFAAVQRTPSPEELNFLDRSMADLMANPPEAPVLSGVTSVVPLNSRLNAHNEATTALSPESLLIFDAKSGSVVSQQVLLPSDGVLFVKAFASSHSPESSFAAVGLKGTMPRPDTIEFYSTKLNRPIALFRLSPGMIEQRLLPEIAVSADGNEILLAYTNQGRKTYSRTSVRGVHHNEADPAYLVKKGDPGQRYRSPQPENIFPFDDFQSDKRPLIFASYIENNPITIDAGGNVHLHRSVTDAAGEKIFAIEADADSKIEMSQDSAYLLVAPTHLKRKSNDAVLKVYGLDGAPIAALDFARSLASDSALLINLQGNARRKQVQATFEETYLYGNVQQKKITTLLWADQGAGFELVKPIDSTRSFIPILGR